MVVLDRIRPHHTLRHLGQRLCLVNVSDDLTVTCRQIALAEPDAKDGDRGEHGLMSLLLLSHAPLELDGNEHVGLAPAANYIVLDYGQFREGEGQRLARGMAWLLDRRDDWNIRIVLTTGWNVLEPGGWITNTGEKPVVQALAPAVEAGLLVVAANGNTRLENELPPFEYFAVGRYDDFIAAGPCKPRPYPDEPWGRNGDGHLRPDILAPGLYLPVPYCETGLTSAKFSCHGQTSGAATLIAGR